MEICRYATAEEFLEATKAFRSADAVRTGLISSIAISVANGLRSYDSYFWLAVCEKDQVSGIAVRTVPYGYVFSPMSEETVQAAISFISTEDPSAREFSGPKAVIEVVEKISKLPVVELEGELIYENRNFKAAPSMGSIRVAKDSDYELIFNWMKAFMEETELRPYDLDGMVRNALAKGRFHLLCLNNSPVSLGGHADMQSFDGFSVGRVGPIYTPMEFRKNGYASSITSELTARIISQGALPMLYTQAENPTSNKIYQELGYTLVDENLKIKFAETSH
jgi:predicted GNAT family acetyltransferase